MVKVVLKYNAINLEMAKERETALEEQVNHLMKYSVSYFLKIPH